MATCNFIKESKQTAGAMHGVLLYVAQDCKTLDLNGRRYLDSVNCVGELAFKEFMATKNLYGKANDVFFHHYVQSFSPDEKVTAEEAHRIGMELAEQFFPGCEVVVATHIDAEHLHSHFIVNSVLPETGMKLHLGKHTLEQMRAMSDQLCFQHGLSVLKPYRQQFQIKGMRTGEYRAAMRGASWKFALINAVEYAMERVGSREQYIDLMQSMGYDVRWENARKNITYACPNGMRCCDDKMHELKFLKENMTNEFRLREQSAAQCRAGENEAASTAAAGSGDHGADADDALHLAKADAGAVGSDASGNPVAPEYPPEFAGYAGNEGQPEASGHDGHAGGVDGAGAGDRRQVRKNDAGYSLGDQLTFRTGWEAARRVYEDALLSGAGCAGAGRGLGAFAQAEDRADDLQFGGSLGHRQYFALAPDEITAFHIADGGMDDGDQPDEEDIPEDRERGRLRAQAEAGNPFAMYRLAKLLAEDVPEEALDWFTEAAERGLDVAQYHLGKMYLRGIMVEPDADEAERWLSRSAVQGNVYAQYLLGKALIDGNFLDEDMPCGVDLLTKAAEQNSQYAAYQLGKLFLYGEHTPKNVDAAIRYFEQAAVLGNIYAEYQLGKIYLFEAEYRDMDKAIAWLNASAQRGNSYAAAMLRCMSENRTLSAATDNVRLASSLERADHAPVIDATMMQPRIDSKRQRKLKEKKIAAGHKPDDHEDYEMKMEM